MVFVFLYSCVQSTKSSILEHRPNKYSSIHEEQFNGPRLPLHFNAPHPDARKLSRRSEGIELLRHWAREVLFYRVFKACGSREFFQFAILQILLRQYKREITSSYSHSSSH